MNNKIKISIITVTFNSEKTIRDTIESVHSQDYDNIEHVIIDGNSKDNTIEIVKSYGDKISYFISEKDDGIYDAMNKGIRAATGDVIGILNSDDFYASFDIISDVVKVFEDDDPDSVYGDLIYVDKDNTDIILRYWESKQFKKCKIRRGWMLPHPTFFIKKEIYNKFGLYSIRLKSAADYEMMVRLLYKNTISVKYIAKVLVNMRNGGISNASIKNRWRANHEDYVSWKINGINPPFLLRFIKPLSKIKQFFRRPKSNG